MSKRLPLRVCDYFFLIGPQLCVPDNCPPDSPPIYLPTLLSRFPAADHSADSEFPRDCPMFCFPSGVQFRTSQSASDRPTSFNFSLTEADGTRLFGAVLTFYEPADEEMKKIYFNENAREESLSITSADQNSNAGGGSGGSDLPVSTRTLFAPKSFCLIGHWPFYTQLISFLVQFHATCKLPPASAASQSLHGLPFPWERLIANFIFETPLPPSGVLEVEYRLLPRLPPLFFRRPPPNARPLKDFPLHSLFQWLSMENILLLFSAVLTEKRVLFISSQYSKLTIAAESIVYLICPFYWRHMFIPILPTRLNDFIAAPFPYICGIHSSHLPDELMLDSVLLVNLDENKLSSSPQPVSEHITALPDKRYQSLIKNLKRHFNGADPNIPIPLNFPLSSITESDLETHFMKFFVRLLSQYRDYLEVPSEFIIDKFDKAKFINEICLMEKGEKEKKCMNQFLTELLDTQLWQCFIDDRYESHSRANNLEVLFFDELIESSRGKSSAFLSDTSNLHQPDKKYTVLAPISDDLPRGSFYSYYQNTHWPLFNESNCLPPREIPRLSDLHDSPDNFPKRVDSRQVSLKFFTEKRLYSQHFHSLRVKSSKQDIHFKSIIKYFQRLQSLEEMNLKEITTIYDNEWNQQANRNIQETGTSIDNVWRLYNLKFIHEQYQILYTNFQFTRESLCIPLYTNCTAADYQLKFLFQEANLLENKAAKGKSLVERAKSRGNLMAARYETLKRSVKSQSSSGALSSSDISKIVSARSESEEAQLSLDEAETHFHTIVSEYEARMPKIIESIREINKERISLWKSLMSRWAAAQRSRLERELNNIKALEESVNSINVEKDLASFSEGTIDFWAISRGRIQNSSSVAMESSIYDQQTDDTLPVEEKDKADEAVNEIVIQLNEEKPAASSNSQSADPVINSSNSNASPDELLSSGGSGSKLRNSVNILRPAVRSNSNAGLIEICYPLNLWGHDGFQLALNSAIATKRSLKEWIAGIEEWAGIVDAKSKRLVAASKVTDSAIVLAQYSTHQTKLLELLKVRSQIHSQRCSDFQLLLFHTTTDLKISRGELKFSIKRFSDHKIKLEKEVAIALQIVATANEKRNKLLKIYQTVEESSAAGLSAVASSSSSSSSAPSTAPHLVSQSSNSNSALSASSASSLHLTQKQLEASHSIINKAEKEYKESEHEYLIAERALTHAQEKRDVCLARILKLMERKAKSIGMDIKKSMFAMLEGFQSFFINPLRGLNENLLNDVNQLDIEKELLEFIEVQSKKNGVSFSSNPASAAASASSSASSSVSLSSAVMPAEKLDFSISFPDPYGYSVVNNLINRSGNYISILEKHVELLVELEENEVKTIRKNNFIIKNYGIGHNSIRIGLESFTTFIEKYCEISEDYIRNHKSFMPLLNQLKISLKSTQKAKEKLFIDGEKLVKKSLEERDKAVAEERKAELNHSMAQKKTEQFQLDELNNNSNNNSNSNQSGNNNNKDDSSSSSSAAGGTQKRSLFGSFMNANPLESLKQKESVAWKELEKCRATTILKNSALAQSESNRNEELKKIQREFQQLELNRWDYLKTQYFLPWIQKHENYLEKQNSLQKNWMEKANSIDIHRDLKEFLTRHSTGIPPPRPVVDDYRRTEKNLKEIRSAALSIQALTDGRRRLTAATHKSSKSNSSTPLIAPIAEKINKMGPLNELANNAISLNSPSLSSKPATVGEIEPISNNNNNNNNNQQSSSSSSSAAVAIDLNSSVNNNVSNQNSPTSSSALSPGRTVWGNPIPIQIQSPEGNNENSSSAPFILSPGRVELSLSESIDSSLNEDSAPVVGSLHEPISSRDRRINDSSAISDMESPKSRIEGKDANGLATAAEESESEAESELDEADAAAIDENPRLEEMKSSDDENDGPPISPNSPGEATAEAESAAVERVVAWMSSQSTGMENSLQPGLQP